MKRHSLTKPNLGPTSGSSVPDSFSEPAKTTTACPFCGRNEFPKRATCETWSGLCERSLEDVLEVFETDDLYVHTNYKYRMQIYLKDGDEPNRVRDELVWSDDKSSRTVMLLKRLGLGSTHGT